MTTTTRDVPLMPPLYVMEKEEVIPQQGSKIWYSAIPYQNHEKRTKYVPEATRADLLPHVDADPAYIVEPDGSFKPVFSEAVAELVEQLQYLVSIIEAKLTITEHDLIGPKIALTKHAATKAGG